MSIAKRYSNMRAQALTPREAQVVNAAMLTHRSNYWRHTVVPSYDHFGKLSEFSSLSAPCQRSTGISVMRADELLVRSVISDGGKFQLLADQWRKERGATSSITQMMLCSAYQQIIGMGERAIPFILTALRSEGDNPDHWGWALHAITGEDPIPPEATGDTVKIAQAWLDWGRYR